MHSYFLHSYPQSSPFHVQDSAAARQEELAKPVQHKGGSVTSRFSGIRENVSRANIMPVFTEKVDSELNVNKLWQKAALYFTSTYD